MARISTRVLVFHYRATFFAAVLFAASSVSLAQTSLSASYSSSVLFAALPDDPSTVQQTSSASTSQNTGTPQTAPPPPPNETPEQRRVRERAQSEIQLKQEEQQRLLGVVPQFNVVMNGNALPLTPGEKWNLALHTAIDPFYIGYAFLSGGYSEISGSHNGFGWGPAGYFKRVGASYADNVNGAIIGNAVLPILLHQDPRYFRQGTGSFKSRFIHAALSTVICHGDNGKSQFNISNIAGNYISGAISNAYYPANERGVALTLENGTEVTAFGAVGGQVLEFAPDIIRHFKKKKTPPAPTAVTPATTSLNP